MNKSNTLYWKTATDPAERIEVRLVLNSYIDNDNLYYPKKNIIQR